MICEDILCFVSNECFLSDVLLFVFCGILRILGSSSPAFLLCVWLILFLRYSPEEQLPSVVLFWFTRTSGLYDVKFQKGYVVKRKIDSRLLGDLTIFAKKIFLVVGFLSIIQSKKENHRKNPMHDRARRISQDSKNSSDAMIIEIVYASSYLRLTRLKTS